MFFAVILVIVVIITGFIIWRFRLTAERNRIKHILGEKKREEDLRLEEKRRLRIEENATINQEERKLRLGRDANAGKVKEERDLREKELRQKISDRKKQESAEEQRKAEDK